MGRDDDDANRLFNNHVIFRGCAHALDCVYNQDFWIERDLEQVREVEIEFYTLYGCIHLNNPITFSCNTILYSLAMAL